MKGMKKSGETQARKPESANKKPRARPHYTQDEKIQAVTILAQMDGLHSESLKQVRLVLGREVNYWTLHNWQTALKPVVMHADASLDPSQLDVAKLVADTRAQLVVSLAGAAQKASKHLNQDSVINAMSGRDAAVVTGITSEKLLLMAGHDVHANELFKAIATECIGTSWDPYHLMEDLLIWLRHKKQSDQTTITIENGG